MANLTSMSIRCALLAPLVTLWGCPPTHPDSDWGERSRDVSPLAAGAPADHFFEISAKKEQNSAEWFETFPIELWAPFTFEITAGLFDPAHANLSGGTFDIDVQSADFMSAGAQFHSMTVSPLGGGGLSVEAESSLDPDNVVGTHDFPGATELDFRFEVVSGMLHFLARKRSDPTFVDLGAVSLPVQTTPLVPGFGAIDLGHKVRIGFDHARLLADALPPGTPTDRKNAGNAIRLAALVALEAFYQVDGPTPDFPNASALLATTLADVDLAKTLVKVLPSGHVRSSALKRLKKARSKLKAAVARVDDGKSAAAYSKLKAALKQFFLATETVDPI